MHSLYAYKIQVFFFKLLPNGIKTGGFAFIFLFNAKFGEMMKMINKVAHKLYLKQSCSIWKDVMCSAAVPDLNILTSHSF